MITARTLSLTAVFGISIGCIIYQAPLISAQREELRRLQAEHVSLLAGEHEQRRLASTPISNASATTAEATSAAIPTAPASANVVDDWLARVQRLKSTLTQRPDLAIPELELLTPADWLQVTRAELPDDERALRKALAALRTAAKDHLVYPLTHAFRTYLERNNGELPPTPFALATYFEQPLNPAILERYEMIRTGNVKDIPNRTRAVMREKAPIDEEYDMRLQVDANGVQGRPAGITAWIDGYSDRYARARDEFKRAYSGATSNDVSQLAPFMQPPLTPAQLEMVRFEQERMRR